MIAARYIYEQEASGLPLIDRLEGMPLDSAEDRMQRTRQALAALEPGITHFIIHPSVDTPELRAITSNWVCRAADYQDFLTDELRSTVRQLGLQVIGYRAIQDVMPKG